MMSEFCDSRASVLGSFGKNFAVGERWTITVPTTEFMVKLLCEGDGASFYYDQASGP